MIVRCSFFNNLVGTSLATCMLSMAVGNLLSWTSPVLPKLQTITPDNPFGEVVTKAQGSWMSSLVTVGGVVGCWVFGALADAIGRKIVFISFGVPILLGYILMVAIPKVEVFYIARFLQGCSMGGGYNMITTYLGEISSKENRGIVMIAPSIFVGGGAIFGYAVGPYVSVTTLNVLETIFPVAFLVTSFLFCQESPYFFLMKNREDLAKHVLKIYRGPNCDLEKEITEMKVQIKAQNEGNVMDIIKTNGYKKAFIIGVGLILGQQFTGINSIVMYSQTIFDLTGSSLSPEVCSMIISVIQLFSGTMLSLLADRFGRKPLLYISGSGMIISESILGVYCIFKDSGKELSSLNFLPVLTLTVFMFCYNFGFGPLCWLIPGEILPIRVKVTTISFLISIYFAVGFLIAKFFYSLVNAVGIGVVFLIYACCCLVNCLFVKFFVLETKGKSIEEIQDILNGRKCE